MSKFLSYIPGFKTDTNWKKVTAIIYYLFCLMGIFTNGFGAFLIIVTIPFILFAIIGIFKDKSKRKAVIIFLCGILLFSIGFKLDDNKQAKETIANNIVIAQNKVIADKKAKAVAEAKIISDKKAIADKKIADAKAIQDKKVADAQAVKDAETARLQAIADKKAEDEKVAQAAKDAQDVINKNTRTFSSGEYNVSKHLDAGAYDITFNGSGNFNVYDKDGNLLTNEVGGSDFGISKYRTILTEGCSIKIAGMSVNTVPATRTLAPYAETSLYAGYWIVGQDVTSGRYTASTNDKSGNFVIYGSDGSAKTNEILGTGEYAVKQTVVDLADGDIIQISSLNNVKFTPSN